MQLITTLIVDDETDGRKTLRHFIEKYCPDVTVVAEAASVSEAVQAIQQLAPELVFLDVSMPGETGFALFDKIQEPSFHTVFVTAYDKYAFQAIKHHALDYILKPVNIDELIETIDHVRKIRDRQYDMLKLQAMLRTINKPTIADKIALPVLDGFIYVCLNEIVRCEAEGNYTQIHFTNRNKLLISRTLGIYEDLLADKGFVRVHHHHLINLQHVEKYQRGRGGIVVMSDRKEIDVAQRRRDEFLKQIDGLSGG